MQAIGGRKFVLGVLYVLGVFACVMTALLQDAGPGVISSVAGVAVSASTGIGVVVYGNIQEHKARNGKS